MADQRLVVLKCYNIVLVGHSFIRRLDEHMKKTPKLRNLHFPDNLADVKCVGLGGGTAMPGPKCLNSVVAEIADSRPDIVFLHVGENDILNGKEPEAVANEIVRMAAQLTGNATRVIVGQLLPLPALESKRGLVVAVNKQLELKLADWPSVKYWRHHNGFWKNVINLMTGQPRRQLFLADRIHLSDEGQHRYHNSINVAVSKAMASLRYTETHVKEPMRLEVMTLEDETPSQSEVQLNDVLPDLIGTDEEKMELV